jgi:hypothetical protein
MSASASPTLSLCFALPPILRTFEMSPTPRLRQNASFLHFTLEPLEHELKRIAWMHQNFCHRDYQRERRLLLLRPEPCDW